MHRKVEREGSLAVQMITLLIPASPESSPGIKLGGVRRFARSEWHSRGTKQGSGSRLEVSACDMGVGHGSSPFSIVSQNQNASGSTHDLPSIVDLVPRKTQTLIERCPYNARCQQGPNNNMGSLSIPSAHTL